MQSSSIPAKYLVPFAQGDSSRVEIPVTTADTTRASQTLGFPPRTMLPPEVSGVAPQGEDFNGAMNQIARAAWWMLQGNGFPYDSTFATDSNILGYAKGAYLPRADFTGYWLNAADNNSTNPEATDGTAANWTPGYNYGSYTLSGVAGSNVTLYPVQAAKDVLVLNGALTASVQIIVPAWEKAWYVINNVAMGAFTLTLKTALGTGVNLATGAQRVRGDGANVVQVAESVAPATTPTQPAQLIQIPPAIQSVSAAVAANALTLGLQPTSLTFRSATLTNGAPSAVIIGSALSLVVPSGATLGTVNTVAARLVLLALNNGGTVQLGVVNLSGGVNLDETTLVSSTAISASATAAGVIYSTSAVTNVPFRVVGFVDISETTAGTWATGPTTVQGAGGEGLTALSSTGYGQSWQTAAIVGGTTYYNTNGKPITVRIVTTAGPGSITQFVGGVNIGTVTCDTTTAVATQAIVPPGYSYSFSANNTIQVYVLK